MTELVKSILNFTNIGEPVAGIIARYSQLEDCARDDEIMDELAAALLHIARP